MFNTLFADASLNRQSLFDFFQLCILMHFSPFVQFRQKYKILKRLSLRCKQLKFLKLLFTKESILISIIYNYNFNEHYLWRISQDEILKKIATCRVKYILAHGLIFILGLLVLQV